jgi:hypothetical protein
VTLEWGWRESTQMCTNFKGKSGSWVGWLGKKVKGNMVHVLNMAGQDEQSSLAGIYAVLVI